MPAHIITRKGTVKVTGQSGETYELRGDFNALCTLEERFGEDITAMDLTRMGMRRVRTFVEVLGGFDSAEAAGDAVQDVGLGAMAEAFGEALAVALRDRDGDAAAGDAAPGDAAGDGPKA